MLELIIFTNPILDKFKSIEMEFNSHHKLHIWTICLHDPTQFSHKRCIQHLAKDIDKHDFNAKGVCLYQRSITFV